MVLPIIIGAAIGAGKQYLDQQEADRQRALNAQLARYSPWTGMKPGAVANPNAAENIGGGALTGFMMNQNMADKTPSATAATAPPPAQTPPPDYSSADFSGQNAWLAMGRKKPWMAQRDMQEKY